MAKLFTLCKIQPINRFEFGIDFHMPISCFFFICAHFRVIVSRSFGYLKLPFTCSGISGNKNKYLTKYIWQDVQGVEDCLNWEPRLCKLQLTT